MDKTKSTKDNFHDTSQTNTLKTKFSARKASKEGVHRFWASLTPKMKKQILNKFHQKDVFELLGLSFFAVEVVNLKTEQMEGLFFYGLEGELSPEKWGLPIPLHDFDYCGSLFLQWLFIPTHDRLEQEIIFECNLELVFSSIFRLNYILFEDYLRDDNPNFLFLESVRTAQSFGKRLFLIPRQKILAPLVIRTAKEEDSDDLTAICNSQSELRTKEHGDHFISEMISSQDSDKMCLVAEDEDGRVVGMMSVSLRMDLTVLEQHFDLKAFGLFCKGDFCESVHAFQRLEREKGIVHSEVKRLHLLERSKILRRMCSYQQNVRLLQGFVKSNVEEHLEDFNIYLEEKGADKKRGLSHTLLGKLVDKHVRTFKFENPDQVFEEFLDDQVQTFVISAREFLFRELRHFGLPADYLDGGGHWQMWVRSQIERKLEEQRSKGLLGKRRGKITKKKRQDEGRANEIVLPSGFDIEPFCQALRRFIEADHEVRGKVASFFLQNEQKLLQLFCESNGEMVPDKTLHFGAIVEGLEAGGFKLPEVVKANLLPILVCFGSLKCEQQTVLLKEKKKFKFIQNKERPAQTPLLKQKVKFEPKFRLNEKTVYKVRLDDLLEAIDQILLEDSFFATREHNIRDLERNFQQEEQEALEELQGEFEALNLEHYARIKKQGVEQSIRGVPTQLLNAACINIFFMEKHFHRRATDFLPFVFTQIRNRDYLILTQPQLANETPLLSHFDLVPQKPSSNFGHSLYFFHRSNLFAQFLKVVPAMPDEVAYLERKLFPEVTLDSEEELRREVAGKLKFRMGEGEAEVEDVNEVFQIRVGENKDQDQDKDKGPQLTGKVELKLKDMYATSVNRKAKISERNGKRSSERSRFFRFDGYGKLYSKESVEKSSTRRKRKNVEKRKAFAKKYKRRLIRKQENRQATNQRIPNNNFEEKSEVSHFKLVFECRELNLLKPIGIASTNSQIDFQSILKDHDLNPLITTTFLSKSDFLRLSLLKVNPLFYSFVPFFVREMLRIFKASIALVRPKDLSQVQNLGNFLKVFPRLPRIGFIKKASSAFEPRRYKALTKSLNYVVSQLPESEKGLTDRIRKAEIAPVPASNQGEDEEDTAPLLALVLGQLSSKKRRVNLRLIVVGNSATSLGILSSLLSLKDLIFNNIVLLSSEFIQQKTFLNVAPAEKCSEPHSLQSLFLHNKIKLVQGKMVSLDRKNKSIVIQGAGQGQFAMHYDYLVITTGLVDKTKDFLEQRGVFSNVFVMELEKVDSSHNLVQLSSNTSANLSMNPLSGGNQYTGTQKLSINGISDHFANQNFPSLQSHKARADPSSRNNFGPSDDEHMAFYQTQDKNVPTDFFVSVDSIQSDLQRRVHSQRPGLDPGDLSKRELFGVLERERGWEGKLLHKKIPKNATLYGESPKIFALLESLLTDFDMDVSKVSLLLPTDAEEGERETLLKTRMSNFGNVACEDNDKLLECFDARVDSPVMFENHELREFYLAVLEFFGVNVLRDCDILGLCEQESSILVRKRKGDSEGDRERERHLGSTSLRNPKKFLRTDLDALEKQETRKNQVNPKFLEFVGLLKNFKYFFDFNMLSPDVVEDLVQLNPDITSNLDDYNLDRRILGLAKTLNEGEDEAGSHKLLKKPFGLNPNVNEEGDDMIQDTIVFLGKTFDVGTSVFKAIQDNGLVFNGRLIVTNNFRTIDRFIYACGKISEFSQRYKNHALGRSLRVDKFDGFEVGKHFASQFVALLRGESFREDTEKEKVKRKIQLNYHMFSENTPAQSQPTFSSKESNPNNKEPTNARRESRAPLGLSRLNHSLVPEDLGPASLAPSAFSKQIPSLEKPVSFKMRLFPGYHYLVIKKPYQGKVDFNKKRYFETTNTLHRDIHHLMKSSSQNIINQIERENKLDLKIKNQKTFQHKKSSKRVTKIFAYNSFLHRIETVKGGAKSKEKLGFEQMLAEGVGHEAILNELREEEPSFGHYLLFEFDENHLVTKIEYMGRDEPYLEAFQNLFGLHRTFFNLMFERRDAGLLDDFVEFIGQEWGYTLSHPMFASFKTEAKEFFRFNNMQFSVGRDCNDELFSSVLQQIISKRGGGGPSPSESEAPPIRNSHVQSDNGNATHQMEIPGPNKNISKTVNNLTEDIDSDIAGAFPRVKESTISVTNETIKEYDIQQKDPVKGEDKENLKEKVQEDQDKDNKQRYKIFLKEEQIYIGLVNKIEPECIKNLTVVIEKCLKNYKDLFTGNDYPNKMFKN